MKEVTTIGLDLAKNVFQVHGVDGSGDTVMRRQLRRSQFLPFFKKQRPCLVGMEACATSHHWARQLIELGHGVKLMPARYVKPYVKRNKNDVADAEAICEAVTRPTMRFVGKPPPGDHPRHRSDHGHGSGGNDHRPFGVHLRPRAGRLDRTSATTEFDRRQGTVRPDIKAGRSVSAMVAGCRCDVRHPPCQAAWHDEPAMAGEPDNQQTHQGRGRGTGQQNSAHCLGRAQTGRDVSKACNRCSSLRHAQTKQLRSLAG